ncbi:hypothetical protein NQ314_012243 [Rhamnusium bicolor]|uniref:Uncharacterized protein n=1 Tax=Rhamnusium bicolor TaxID=1586634 RepID=A0AAV8XDG0_9CUCU|nr:hypothetical protein NQ314_012243 [Rhamnusium bicolor]
MVQTINNRPHRASGLELFSPIASIPENNHSIDDNITQCPSLSRNCTRNDSSVPYCINDLVLGLEVSKIKIIKLFSTIDERVRKMSNVLENL